MTAAGIGQIVFYAVVLVALGIPLGAYMARVYTGKATFAQRILGPFERVLYRIFGVKPDEEMTWKHYAFATMLFNVLGILVVYLLQRLQGVLPGNPLDLPAVDPRVAFNTAVSFGSNTNWQSYGGETTMSHLVQALALGVQNFVSAATGMAVLVALTRAFKRKHADAIGNFWVDLTRSTIYILVPLAIITALALVWQGVPQTTDGKEVAALLDAQPGTPPEGAKPDTVVPPITEQGIAVGPVASQIAIKQLGTNGGGFYNVNSAHPLENPTPLSNFIQCIAILLIPLALCFTFGRMVGSRKQGVALLVTMTLLVVPFLALTLQQEQAGNPALISLDVDQQATDLQAGGNMEGKEVRNGISASALWANATTAASNGSVNSMHDSYTPLGGVSPIVLMALGEVAFGGVGSGLYGLLIFAIVAVFIAGLMVGRTPEFLGKKIEAFEMKMASLAILVPVAATLVATACACLVDETYAKALANHGPHGFSEVLYAFTSQSNNNGSAFAGLTASGTFFATAGGICMWVARYWIIIPTLAIAGSLARKKIVPPSSGTLPTDGPLFVLLLAGTVVLVGALSFIPALALGPIVEHLILSRSHAMTKVAPRPLFDPPIVKRAIRDAFGKLDPRRMIRNPVMFVVEIGSIFTTLLFLHALITGAGDAGAGFIGAISLWLWFTVLFANFAEAMAEGRGKAQADSLRKARRDVPAIVLDEPRRDARRGEKPSSQLRTGDLVLVEVGQVIPGDGEIVEGVASVNESAITGESAPVIRESGGDRSAVTGGTTVLSDWLIVRITAAPGESFLDRMISMVEGAKRKKTPNEIALDILLAGLTIVFLLVTVTLYPFSVFAVKEAQAAGGTGQTVTLTVLVALLVCLIPTTIGGLLSAIGIAGMDRMIQANVIATSGRAVEAAGDVDVLLLDKTGTITHGNRQATAFLPAKGVTEAQLAEAAVLASLSDDTPEGKSIVALGAGKLGRAVAAPEGATVVPFTAQTRMSGVDGGGRTIRKGASDAITKHIAGMGAPHRAGEGLPTDVRSMVDAVAKQGGTPLVVADGGAVLGVVQLSDIVKDHIKDRFGEMRRMGIKTVMITGDNPLTAAAIAAEAGVDDFLAEATPEAKLAMIRDYQEQGHLVAMTGDGTNDAPALAQADVAVAMNSGTQAAKEAGNMVDLDSNPTKLLEVVTVGKQMLITRGALTTFSIANDVSKYFAIIPAAFVGTYPQLEALDIMDLHSPASAVLSAVIFNALIIIALIPLALRGIKVRPAPAPVVLRRNLLVFGFGGLVLPFPFIKLIDVIISGLGLVS